MAAPEPHTQVEVERIPPCDLCDDGTPAAVDGKTIHGPWANMCEAHFERFGIGLGLGRGQRLIQRERS